MFSLALIAIIGFQGKIKTQFLKALFHAFLISLCFILISGILLPIILGGDLGDFKLCFLVSFFPFYILCPSDSFGWLFLLTFWGIYLTLMACSFRIVRKSKHKKRRIAGHIGVVFVFGAIYAACYYFTLKAVVAVIAIAIMTSR